MCGFVAILSPGVPIREEILAVMRDRLIHRGPDNGSSWLSTNQRIGLAHRRLSIIDTSHEADQPMATADGAYRIVFNGEIYNYMALRAELVACGVQFHTQSDTEVLLNGFAQWGEGVLNRLNGMFAFAIWDERRKQVFVARDRFGEKPLFIGRGENRVVVMASEMKAILAHPLMPASASAEAINRYGRGAWYEDDALTFFEGIERFPPAHAAVFSEDGTELRKWRYWTPDYTDINEDLRPSDAAEQFGELLQRSVRLRLRADVPVGSSLSGGLDSSVIVGMLAQERELGTFSQNTFSACFNDDPAISEGPQIDEVVKHTGVNSFRVMPSPEGLMAESLKLHWHQEEPFLSASIYLQWCVARLALEHETTVLLDGQGADELLAGYQFYFKAYQLDLLDRGQFVSAARETATFNGRLKKAAQAFPDSRRRFNERVAYSLPELLALVFKRPGVWHGAYEVGVVKPERGRRLRRTLGEALQYNCLPMLLRYADRNAMAFSREARLPFLDYDLVDFCIRLPDRCLIRDGWQKWVLRESADRLIPESIRWRADKVGYAAPLDIWLRGALKEWGYKRVFSDRLNGVEGYDRLALQKLWQEHQDGAANNSWALWRWISLAEWFHLLDSGWWKQPA